MKSHESSSVTFVDYTVGISVIGALAFDWARLIAERVRLCEDDSGVLTANVFEQRPRNVRGFECIEVHRDPNAEHRIAVHLEHGEVSVTLKAQVPQSVEIVDYLMLGEKGFNHRLGLHTLTLERYALLELRSKLVEFAPQRRQTTKIS